MSTVAERVTRNARDRDPMERLIEGLNQDLRGEYQAAIMYRLFGSTVQGPHRKELRAFFLGEIPGELAHAQLLSDKIAALGGAPAGEAAPVTMVSEPDAMLTVALQAEIETIERYIQRRAEAEAAGEHGLAVELDTLIADETRHRDELRQMLAHW